MKKILAVIMAFSLLAGWSTAVLVDDFNGYSTGLVTAVASPPWTAVQSGGAASVALIQDIDGKCLTVNATPLFNYTHTVYKSISPITNANTATTLFFRFRAGTGTPNTSIGLSTTAAPGGGTDFNLYGPQIRVNNTAGVPTFNVRNGGAFTANYNITIGQWYNVWAVINQSTDKFDIYLTTGSNDATNPANVLYTLSGNGFRVAATTNLVTFLIMSQGGSGVPNDNPLNLDDIHVTDGAVLTSPITGRAHTPIPNNAVTVPTDTTTTVSWSTGMDPANSTVPNPAITKHYVYIREGDPNLVGYLKQTIPAGSPVQATASCTLSSLGVTLALEKTYYWRVDESVNDSLPGDPNTIKGSTWSFLTPPPTPVITPTGQPVNVRVFTPAAASFTTVFTSVNTPVTVVWKKNGAFYSSGTYTGTNPYTTTLTFATTADSDQATYTCELSVSGQPTPTVSNTVTLVTKKLLAYYAFENNLNDSSSYGPHNGIGKSVADPNITAGLTYAGGIVGSSETGAVEFNGSAIVDLGTGAYPKTGLGNGMDEATISCWVKATQLGGLISNYNDNILAGAGGNPLQLAANTTGFDMELTGASLARLHLRGELSAGTPPIITESLMGAVQGAPVTTPAFNMINDGFWHQVATTWKAGDLMIVYVDGVQVASTTALTPASFAAWQRGVVLGAIRTIPDRAEFERLYTGLMDDLRVYNYVKNAHEVADIYNEATGEGVCTETYASTYDFDKNCVVDLADFVVLAANWLDCGLYPIDTCP